MNWCNYCTHQTEEKTCGYTKTKGTPCATANKKMIKEQDNENAEKHGVR